MSTPKLQLERPIVFFDLETTGLDKDVDQICQVGLIRYNRDWSKGRSIDQLINPGIPIPKEVSEIHGITDEMVADAPTWREFATSLFMVMSGCDLAGFNSNRFDVPFVYTKFAEVGLELDYKSVNLIDVGNIYKIQKPRTLIAAAMEYCQYDLADAHNAMADTEATAQVFFEQLKQHEDLPSDPKALALYSNHDREILDLSGKFTTDADGDIVFTFGPHRGVKAKNELGFVNWMLSKDFASDTKAICTQLTQK